MAGFIHDISIPISEDTPVWPTSERFDLRWKKNMEKDGVNESSFTISAHTGTHIDVPYHFHNNGKRIGDIPVENFIGDALVVEYRSDGDIQPDFLAGIEIPPGCRKILFKTRNSFDEIMDHRRFQEDYVALSLKGAEWIVRNKIDLVGIDYLSIERFGEKGNKTHKILLDSEVLILEGLDLRNVSKGVYKLLVFPLNIPEAEAAPVRAILINQEDWRRAF